MVKGLGEGSKVGFLLHSKKYRKQLLFCEDITCNWYLSCKTSFGEVMLRADVCSAYI